MQIASLRYCAVLRPIQRSWRRNELWALPYITRCTFRNARSLAVARWWWHKLCRYHNQIRVLYIVQHQRTGMMMYISACTLRVSWGRLGLGTRLSLGTRWGWFYLMPSTRVVTSYCNVSCLLMQWLFVCSFATSHDDSIMSWHDHTSADMWNAK